MANSERKALSSHLVVLITHIIKWYTQPWKRSNSWRLSIKNSREAIEDLLMKHPSLKSIIDVLIPEAIISGTAEAEGEMKIKSTKKTISKKELFDDTYDLEE